MSADSRRTLVAYDVPEDKRRTKLAKRLEKYGDRVQYSVFVVDCGPARMRRLKDEVLEVINQAQDSVLFCDLGPLKGVEETRFTYLGVHREVTASGPLVF